MSLEKYMPPSERLDVSTVYSMEPLSSSLRSLTGTLRLKRGVVLSLVYINPPVKLRLNTEGGLQVAPVVGAKLSHKAHLEETRNTKVSPRETNFMAAPSYIRETYDAALDFLARRRRLISGGATRWQQLRLLRPWCRRWLNRSCWRRIVLCDPSLSRIPWRLCRWPRPWSRCRPESFVLGDHCCGAGIPISLRTWILLRIVG